MAPFPLFFASALVLAYLGFVPRFTAAQGVPCQGYGGLPGATTNCYIDPSTGSELEMGVVAVGDCAQVTLLATAIYTGVDALVTAVASPEIDVGPPATNENDEAYLYFDFPVAYSDIANDSLFTYILVYVTEGATGTLADGTSTINKVSTLVYTAITDTVISTTDTTKTVSSTTTDVTIATVTPTTTLVETSAGQTSTVTAKQATITTTITITPAVSTRTHTIHSVTTATITCLGSPSAAGVSLKRRFNRPRGQAVAAPELMDCSGIPSTTIIVTSAAVTTTTVTATDTDVVLVGSTSTSTVTAATPVSYVSGKVTRVTATPSATTVTRTKSAKGSTTTATTTQLRTVTKLPCGGRTPKCPSARGRNL